MKITVDIPGAGAVEVSTREGWTLMEAIRDAGLPIIAQCGGGGACATCHVHVTSDCLLRLPEVKDDERGLLESSDFYDASHSRLSCQIICNDQIDGVRVILQPDSFE